MCRMKKVSLFLVDLKLEYVNHRLKKTNIVKRIRDQTSLRKVMK